MGKQNNNNQWAPRVKPVERIELSGKNGKLRIVLIIVLLVIAAVSLAAGLTALLNREPGWQEVAVSTDQVHCGEDFVLYYDFGDAGISATEENKQLTALYSDAAAKAWQLFSSETAENGNLAYLNAHVNETVTVDPALHTALALVARYESRYVFLGAVYNEYARMFISESAAEAARYDPAQNADLMPYIQQAAAFANDPAAIRLEILENDQVKLTVSEEYLTFAEDYEFTEFVDFGWMTNAFIADYIAGILEENGFTRGYLVSYDGFTRNLDSRGEAYALNLFDRQDNDIYIPAKMHYSGPMSIVSMRNFPLSDRDRWHYYSFADSGRVATVMIDPEDGMDKSALHDLVCYSRTSGCAQILLQAAPIFIADEFSEDALLALAGQEIYAIWPQGTVLCYNEETLNLEMIPDTGIAYTKELTK